MLSYCYTKDHLIGHYSTLYCFFRSKKLNRNRCSPKSHRLHWPFYRVKIKEGIQRKAEENSLRKITQNWGCHCYCACMWIEGNSNETKALYGENTRLSKGCACLCSKRIDLTFFRLTPNSEYHKRRPPVDFLIIKHIHIATPINKDFIQSIKQPIKGD